MCTVHDVEPKLARLSRLRKSQIKGLLKVASQDALMSVPAGLACRGAASGTVFACSGLSRQVAPPGSETPPTKGSNGERPQRAPASANTGALLSFEHTPVRQSEAVSRRKTRTPPEREREGRGLGNPQMWANYVTRAPLRKLPGRAKASSRSVRRHGEPTGPFLGVHVSTRRVKCVRVVVIASSPLSRRWQRFRRWWRWRLRCAWRLRLLRHRGLRELV